MEEFDLLDAFEAEDADQEILSQINAKKNASKKSFNSVINKKKLDRFELDDVMV